VSRLDDDPVVALAAPRADFDGAMQELLVGLLTAAVRPADEAAWLALWKAPPSVEALQAALGALPDAFDLEGDGPRFFQDLSAADFASAEPKPIDQLLIDSPGEQGVSLNKDLFVKRARVQRVSRPVAAMALVTMQTYAPAGGQGYRTSMRGGGPLTTLVDPRDDDANGVRAAEQPLWQMVWANVETAEQLAARTPGNAAPADTAFPWLAPTRTSNLKKGGVSTTPTHAHPLQAYFGLPRRIRLELADGGTCELTGRADERTVTGFRAVNYGVQYDGWKHPLSPHYRTKPSDPWFPTHGQPGGIAWRDWLSLTLGTADDRSPAQNVAHFANRRAARVGCREFRVHVFGYDMENMKARGWTEALVPAFAADEARRELVHGVAGSLVGATSRAATALLVAVKTAFFQRADDASGDLDQVKLELWAETERPFYAAVRAVADAALDDAAAMARVDEERRGYAPTLKRAALDVFDRWCPGSGLDVDALRRRVAARYQLSSALGGYTKLGEEICAALGIAPPGGGRAGRAAKTAGTAKEKKTRTSKEKTK
jgi:CRISPR system Cascade subunit CasA